MCLFIYVAFIYDIEYKLIQIKPVIDDLIRIGARYSLTTYSLGPNPRIEELSIEWVWGYFLIFWVGFRIPVIA